LKDLNHACDGEDHCQDCEYESHAENVPCMAHIANALRDKPLSLVTTIRA
jgi:hypothetical protein